MSALEVSGLVGAGGEVAGELARLKEAHERASGTLAETFEGLLDTARRNGRSMPEIAEKIAEVCAAAEAMEASVIDLDRRPQESA